MYMTSGTHGEECAELLLASAWWDAANLDPALLERHCGWVNDWSHIGIDKVGVDAAAQRGIESCNSADARRQGRATCMMRPSVYHFVAFLSS